MTNQIFEIHAKDNAKIKHLRGLCEQASVRRKHQQTILEGIHLIDAWIKSGKKGLAAIFLTQQALEHHELQALLPLLTCPIYSIPVSLYQDIRTLGPGIDVMAVIDTPTAEQPINQHDDILILEGLQDPGNVGTLLRTAAAAGIKQIVCSTGTAAIWSPRVLRAGMGAQFSLRIYEHYNVAELLQQIDIPVYVTSSHATTSLYNLNLKQPSVWLMGNEGQGASEFAIEHAHPIAIPQPGGQESLNVAIAGAICMFEMVRQRINPI